jgi:hypothetical protein
VVYFPSGRTLLSAIAFTGGIKLHRERKPTSS